MLFSNFRWNVFLRELLVRACLNTNVHTFWLAKAHRNSIGSSFEDLQLFFRSEGLRGRWACPSPVIMWVRKKACSSTLGDVHWECYLYPISEWIRMHWPPFHYKAPQNESSTFSTVPTTSSRLLRVGYLTEEYCRLPEFRRGLSWCDQNGCGIHPTCPESCRHTKDGLESIERHIFGIKRDLQMVCFRSA